MSPLLSTLRADVEAFLQTCNELFFNERDFQMHLAVYLRLLGKYDDVDVEYYVPYAELGEDQYIWENELRLDVVVRRGNAFAPIELKYKTKKVSKPILRFNEPLKDVVVMKNQSAQDLGRYAFWKDVRRVELVRRRFPAVEGGLAVFLTNDAAYTRSPKPQSVDHLLSMSEGAHSEQKHWADESKACAKGRKNFDVEKAYAIHWEHRTIENIDMHYCIVTI